MFSIVKQILGAIFQKVGGLIVWLIRIMLVVALLQGLFTGKWGGMLLALFTLFFVLMVARGTGNEIARYASLIPFADELFSINPELLEKGRNLQERFMNGTYNLFHK